MNHLWDQLAGGGAGAASAQAEGVAASFQDTDQFTWGLQAIGVPTTRFTGQGIKVAILDTGFDLNHPDFRGRAITSETFTGVPVQDVLATERTAWERPVDRRDRLAVYVGMGSPRQRNFVGKVFDNAAPRPSAATGNVIAGIEWAITNGCQVVSMSLGIPLNQKVMQYETPIRRALQAGTFVGSDGWEQCRSTDQSRLR